ncbi:MAG: hypothetical protein AAGD14_13245 [Planctomycetota bacterium]
MSRWLLLLLIAVPALGAGLLAARGTRIHFEDKELAPEPASEAWAGPAAGMPAREPADVVLRADAPSTDAYRFTLRSNGAPRIEAGSRRAALFAQTRTPHDLGRWIEPRYARRYVDCGAVGIEYRPEEWGTDDYTHTLRAFHRIEDDAAARARAVAQMETYANRMAASGYNGVVLPAFLDLLDRANPKAPERRRALRAILAPARALGFDVVFRTDMLALTKLFEQQLVGLDPDDPAFWRAYAGAVDELFSHFPEITGLMVRIGEAGGCYNDDEHAQYSKLGVTTPARVRAMLRALASAADRHGKQLFLRTWSIGVGDVGDLHTNPASLARVMEGLDLDNLVLSTKHVQGDFGSYLPVNPTLRVGTTPRLVEFQSRREFEGCGAYPNYVGALHQASLQALRDAPIDGVWVWNQNGGPQRAGPATLFPFHGEDAWIDLNTYATGRLAWDPDADLSGITRDWIRARWTDDPTSVRALEQMLALSRDAVRKGLYVGAYARRRVLAAGLEPPPMAFVFWNLPGGAHSTLTSLFRASRDELDEAVVEGEEAVAVAERMRALVAGARFRDASDRTSVLAAIDYELDLLRTLSSYREAFLQHYLWLATGDATARARFDAASVRFDELQAAHETRYGASIVHPAYNFEEADAATRRMRGNAGMAWLARLLLLGAACWAWRRRSVSLVGAWCFGLATAACFSFFVAPGFVVVAMLLAAALLHATRDPRPLVAASIVVLAACSVRGPLGFWFAFWDSETVRGLTVAILLATVLWAVSRVRRPIPYALAALLAITLVPGTAFDWMIAVINEELVVLPFAMARTLGLATHLNVEFGFGASAICSGVVLAALFRRRLAAPLAQEPTARELRRVPPRGQDRRSNGRPAPRKTRRV